ncbi:MAG: ABC transporter ATP-binding protein [Alphaproteobacteria bacterium]|nr:ABC transporter ATP-binding protein [Alphaproteobacteria bacterium]
MQNLTKNYAGKPAVAGVSFEVQAGETYALLGPNGAGKTTTIEILEGYRRRDGGEVSVLGADPGVQGNGLRERIGIVLQTTALEPELTVEETVTNFRSFYPNPHSVGEVLELVDLGFASATRVKALSGGQQRRLEIGLGLIGNPDLVFLDEPTTGLDPDARRNIWNLVLELNAMGKTILLSSHYMDEVEALAHRLAVLVDGKIKAEGSPQSLRDQHGAYTEVRFYLGERPLPESFPPALRKIIHTERGWVIFEVPNPTPFLADLTNWSFKEQFELPHLSVTQPSLEEIYLNPTRGRRGAARNSKQAEI